MSRTTLDRVLTAGPVLQAGRDGDHRALDRAGGEPHRVRRELVGPAWEPPRRGVQVVACLAHVTDLQLADVCSPARFEFFHRLEADPRMRALVPMHRPQEALAARHRELAANVPWAGLGSALAGTPADRTVELVLRAPF